VHGDCRSDRGGGPPDGTELALTAAPPDALSTPLAWDVWPCSRNWLLAGLALAFILCLSFVVQLYFGSAWWGGLTLVLLLLSVLPYYTRTHYRLDEQGVVARGPIATYRRSWSDIRAFFPHADGVLLSTLAKPSRLAYTRGLFLRFNNNRDEVLERVEAYLEHQKRGDGDPRAEPGVDG
jgi:hypothetical protein